MTRSFRFFLDEQGGILPPARRSELLGSQRWPPPIFVLAPVSGSSGHIEGISPQMFTSIPI